MSAAVLVSALSITATTRAEVTVARGETWDAYVAGRVGAFLSYAIGDAYPVPKQPGSTIQPGGGVDPEPQRDVIYEYDAAGMPLKTKHGKLNKMRLRSGYYPNILTAGVHKSFGPELRITGQLSIWGAIESDDVISAGDAETTPANGIRDNGVSADFREGFMRLEGGWGQVDGGRFISFAGRGVTEIDVLYAHGYGAGFPSIRRDIEINVTGDLSFPGPTGGMAGFGLLSATYAAGVTYTTPEIAGFRLGLGVFDAAKYTQGGWGTTRAVRPEAQVTYDLQGGGLAVHVFVDGGYQTLAEANGDGTLAIWGATGGARIEVGPLRLGAAGFVGSGFGLNHSFDFNNALTSPATMRDVTLSDGTKATVAANQARTQRGFFGIAQLVLGPIDLHAGAGQTVVLLLPEDEAIASSVSVVKSQTGITGGVVYHLNESFHLDVDYFNAGYRWYGGERQKLHVLNAGVTLTF